MITLRPATKNDAKLIVDFMHKLGEFQKMPASITVTPENMTKLLRDKDGEAVLAFEEEKPVAFAYFCQHSSAFIGRTSLYIDAFYIEEEYRKKGIGKKIMQYLAQICKERNYARMEWLCLDWNTNAWDFYIHLGATAFDTMTIHRLYGENLEKLQKK